MVSLKQFTLLALTTGLATVAAQSTGKTTRYWDCCKGSCAWEGKASVTQPLRTCDKNDNPISDLMAKNGCESGGTAFMCTNQTPWAVNDSLAYGFAAVKLAGKSERDSCCACYELTFTSGPVVGQKMIVQSTNTGGDLGDNHFDIAMPGGGVGIFNGCTAQFGAPSTGWGQQYGGISNRSECDNFPEKLKAGCKWRFDWFKNADNPTISFKEVTCPGELTNRTGCIRV
ncbi:glycoside hydrolase family 45 protein [Bipolaris victoriae FI3]|uniref:Cellulase n=2 Tax=Bipolaris TaxID=33194 RepID=W6XVQ1_COCC2|nr:glycoside hydrolase family 45 protein [Bipolaris zeicola 26-R-13]XP_014558353.1 glycoside hydrolase family 45 protein [Bipolaris victoriae FI3]EUC31522.1 glycoside hydrolase family 45 protein [Bipolaris zeicola 26-R-13]